jgi:ABC-2 type transport system permease protein
VAGIFVRLKARLLLNGFRLGWQPALGLVLVVVTIVPMGLLASVSLALIGLQNPPIEAAVISIVLVVVGLGWMLLPVLVFGMDDTVDPHHLQLLPLTRPELAAGMLASSALGAGAVVTAAVVAGLVIGAAKSLLGAVIALAAGAVYVLLCMVAARALTTALSARLRSRRGRDVVVGLAVLFFAVFFVVGQLPRLLSNGEPSADVVADLADRISAVIPFGWPAQAIIAAGSGRLLFAVAWLAGSIAITAAAGWLWLVLLERSMVASPPQQAHGADRDLFPAAMAWLPRNHLGAATAKELRYLSRVPQLRVQLLLVPVLVIGAPIAAIVQSSDTPALVLAAGALGLVFGLVSFNAFGADGAATWMVVGAGPDWRDIAAKNLALALVALPVVIVTALALAAVTAGWSYVVPAVLLGASALGIFCGVGNIAAVLAPSPLPESPTNVFSTTSGMGCATMLVQLLAMTLAVVVLAPVAAVVFLEWGSPAGINLVAVLACLWGLVGCATGVRISAAQLELRGPAIVTALTPRG